MSLTPLEDSQSIGSIIVLVISDCVNYTLHCVAMAQDVMEVLYETDNEIFKRGG